MFKERRKARLAGVSGDCCEVGRDHVFVGHGLKTKNKTNKQTKKPSKIVGTLLEAFNHGCDMILFLS